RADGKSRLLDDHLLRALVVAQAGLALLCLLPAFRGELIGTAGEGLTLATAQAFGEPAWLLWSLTLFGWRVLARRNSGRPALAWGPILTLTVLFLVAGLFRSEQTSSRVLSWTSALVFLTASLPLRRRAVATIGAGFRVPVRQ